MTQSLACWPPLPLPVMEGCCGGRWFRPTLDVIGQWGGFTGAGVKTIVPGKATAKVTCRLVPDQDPFKILEVE